MIYLSCDPTVCSGKIRTNELIKQLTHLVCPFRLSMETRFWSVTRMRSSEHGLFRVLVPASEKFNLDPHLTRHPITFHPLLCVSGPPILRRCAAGTWAPYENQNNQFGASSLYSLRKLKASHLTGQTHLPSAHWPSGRQRPHQRSPVWCL